MKKNIKYILIVAGLGIIFGIAAVLFTFFKPQRNIEKEKPAYIMEPGSFCAEFSTNEDSSYIKYRDQVIQLTGEVIEFSLEENSVSVVFVKSIGGITCSFDSITMVNELPRLSKILVGDTLTLKGRCDGYDMIMGVVLSRCVLLNQPEN
jgi:tRNA_anti-like